MISWLRDLHWSLYYEHGIRWLSKPPKREWRVLLLPGMEPPPPQPGYTQVVTKLPEHMAGLMGAPQRCEAGYDHAQTACPVHGALAGLLGLGARASNSQAENPLSRFYNPRRFDDI